MKIILPILKVWLIGLIIVLPVVLSFCKSAKIADKFNKLITKKN